MEDENPNFYYFFSVIFPPSQDKCEHVVLTEMLNVTLLEYGQELKFFFFLIKNFMEADFLFFSYYEQIRILILFNFMTNVGGIYTLRFP